MSFGSDDAPATTRRADDQPATETDADTFVGRTVTINRPREEIYAFWRDFSNLAGIMENVESITTLDDKTSRWVVKAPGGKTVEWISMVVEDQPGKLISWRSAEEADVANEGTVEFLDAAPGRGTMVRATIAYDPPAGVLGEWVAKLFQREPNVQARRDLRRLKQFLETGEVTSSASPSGRSSEDPTKQSL